MAINYYTDTESNVFYLPSSQVKVFPCGWRGANATTDVDIDIESKLSTEYNFTHISGLSGLASSYIKAFNSIDNSWEFVIAGYHFRITDVSLSDIKNFVFIDFRDVSLSSSDTTETPEKTKVLKSWHKISTTSETTESEILDFEKDGNYYFAGLAFSDTDISSEHVSSEYLRLRLDTGDLNMAAFLPEIHGGNGESSVSIGTDININGNNIFAAGDDIVAGTDEAPINEAILLGNNIQTFENNTIIIGSNLKSKKENQFIIGNTDGIEQDTYIEPIEVEDDFAILGKYGVAVGINNEINTNTYNINFDKVNIISIKDKTNNEKIKIDAVANYNVDPLATVNGMIHLNGGFDLKENNTSYLKTNFTDDKKVSSLQLDIPLTTSKNIEIQDELKITKNNNSLLVSSANTAVTDFVNLTCNGETDPIKVTDGTNTVSIDKSFNLDYTASEDAELTVTLGSQKINLDKDLLDVATKLYVTENAVLKSNIYVKGEAYFGATTSDPIEQTTDVYIKDGEVKATTFWATSDRRAKENISEYKSQKSILDLPVYKYDYINGPKNQIGCMAQDLREICPEMVHEETNGMLSVDNSKVVYLLLNEVKKLRNELSELKAK